MILTRSPFHRLAMESNPSNILKITTDRNHFDRAGCRQGQTVFLYQLPRSPVFLTGRAQLIIACNRNWTEKSAGHPVTLSGGRWASRLGRALSAFLKAGIAMMTGRVTSSQTRVIRNIWRSLWRKESSQRFAGKGPFAAGIGWNLLPFSEMIVEMLFSMTLSDRCYFSVIR